MTKTNKLTFINILTIITFIIMIAANALANIIPIGGANTGDISDSYPNLFAPAAITFSIWLIIYILLFGFTLYQAGVFKRLGDEKKQKLVNNISLLFMITSVTNTGWIFAWHYKMIGLSLILMISLLAFLIAIMLKLKNYELSSYEKVFVRLPFSIYFGWITVAAIANIITFLVSVNWDGFGLSNEFWAIAVISVGIILGALTICRFKDFFYGLVLIWAYLGIIIKHVSNSGFGGEYTSVIITTSIGIAVFVGMIVISLIKKYRIDIK